METTLHPINKMILEERKKATLLMTASVMAVIAGANLILSGYTSSPILLNFLRQIGTSSRLYLPPAQVYDLKLVTSTLSFLMGFGGFLVFIGGLLFFRKHRSSSKYSVGIGAGMGVFGLLFFMTEANYLSAFSLVQFHAEYWISIVIASAAIWVAKKA